MERIIVAVANIIILIYKELNELIGKKEGK